MNIVCPCCKAEYHPSEIFVPVSLIGRPKYVKKGIDGTIEDVIGDTSITTETFVCDYCNKEFSTQVTFKFETKCIDKINIDEDYITPLYKSSNIFPEN